MSAKKLTPSFGKRFVYVNNFSQLPKTPAGAKHLVDTLKREFSAGEYNLGLAGECYATEAEARKRLRHPDDCYFVVEVPAEAIHGDKTREGFAPKLMLTKTKSLGDFEYRDGEFVPATAEKHQLSFNDHHGLDHHLCFALGNN